MTRRSLFFERLETRTMLTAVTELNLLHITGNVGEKPESKLWEHDDTWFAVMSDDSGSFVWRLDGTSWTPVFELPGSAPEPAKADVKVDGEVTHVLLESDSDTKLMSLQYVSGTPGTYELWSERPVLADIDLAFSVEAATIDIDSTGRMWVAYDNNADTIQVRYSDAPYDDWTASPITLASDVHSDDISVVTAMPNQTIAVMWSDQNADLFGFRVHVDGDHPASWSKDETPASQSAINVGHGMADDHINLAVAPDSTLYAAVKTSYDTPGYPEVLLLVRRPDGIWDDAYSIDNYGTRPGVWLNVANNQLIYVYEADEFYYRECPTSTLACGPAQFLLANGKNSSSTKQNVTNDLVIVTSGKGASGKMWGAQLTFDVLNNTPPSVAAGSGQTIFDVEAVTLNGSVTDDGLPDPPARVTTTWDVDSGPGRVTFSDPSAIDTTATFDAPGVYVLRLSADDGELTSSDVVTVTVNETPINQPPAISAGADQSAYLSQTVLLDGTVADDGLPIPPGNLSAQWTVASGPAAVTFGDATSVDTTVRFSAAGIYVLRLTVDDGALSASDEISIVVEEDPINAAPLVDAGSDETILLSGVANLRGIITDDDRPDPPAAVAAAWSQVSGPGVAIFTDNQDPETVATFDQLGTYVLRLTADDGALAASDDVTITVIEDPPIRTISFQDGVAGYAGTLDVKMRSDKPTLNFGSTTRLELDGNPDFSTVIKWDVSAIPQDANVISASITVNVIRESNDTFEIYEMLRPWKENRVTFTEADTGVAWDVPGAQGTGDRGSDVLGELTAPATGHVTVELNVAGRAVLQNWISNPHINHGFILQDYDNESTDDLDFESREASNTANRPELRVVYAVPPTTELSIDDVTVDEDAGTATFEVALSAPSSLPIDFDFTTSGVTAMGGADFTPVTGNKSIPPGVTSTAIVVDILDDMLDEDNETFHVSLSNAINATILDGVGVGTIIDNDVSLSINDVTIDESAGTAAFTVTLNGTSALPVDFSFATSDDTATAGNDYVATSGQGTIAPGSTSTTVTVDITDDSLGENDESFHVNLSNPINAAILDGTGVGTITDNEVSISIDDVSVDEDRDEVTLTVSLSEPTGLPVDFAFATSDVTATEAADYTAASGRKTIDAGLTSTTITIAISRDALDEEDEVFEVILADVVNAVVLDDRGQVTITDNDPTPTLTISDVAVDESEATAVFVVSIDAPSGRVIEFAFMTSDITATAGSDYALSTDDGYRDFGGHGIIRPGSTSTTITLDIFDDVIGEIDETFEVVLSNPVHATVTDGVGLGTILDNEVSLSINDVSVHEGEAVATFTVTLSGPTNQPVDFTFTTSDVSAAAGSDYHATSGLITIEAGSTSATLTVEINDDILGEADEVFEVILSDPVNATIFDDTGVGTIHDDDVRLMIDDVTVDEGAGTATFTASLNAAVGLPVEFTFTTADGAAVAGFDYASISGNRTIEAGSTSTTIVVDIIDDGLDEPPEAFEVMLSNATNATILDGTGMATITDNDDGPSLSIEDITVDEGIGAATFTVRLSEVSGLPVEFSFATSDVSATAGSDYAAVSGSQTIEPGATSSTITVSITDDTLGEQPESFEVHLSNVMNATILDGTGAAVIEDDDVSLVVDDVSVDEGAGTLTFLVTLNRISVLPVAFRFATADVSATAGSDYTAASGTRTIDAGLTSTTIVIDITDDVANEPDETFEVILSNATNATILDDTGVGTITNDDATLVTLSFQDEVLPTPAYSGTRDTKIRGDFPDRPFGSSGKLDIDGKPDIASFIKWDISQIPEGSVVESVAITVHVIDTSTDVFEIYQALQPWSEDETTYNQVQVGMPWDVVGAQGAGDRGATVLGTITAPSLGTVTIDLNAAGVAVVQSWIDGSAVNNGFLFQDYQNASTDDLDFASRDKSDPLTHPILTIQYSEPPAAASIAPTANAQIDVTGASVPLRSSDRRDLPPLSNLTELPDDVLRSQTAEMSSLAVGPAATAVEVDALLTFSTAEMLTWDFESELLALNSDSPAILEARSAAFSAWR